VGCTQNSCPPGYSCRSLGPADSECYRTGDPVIPRPPSSPSSQTPPPNKRGGTLGKSLTDIIDGVIKGAKDIISPKTSPMVPRPTISPTPNVPTPIELKGRGLEKVIESRKKERESKEKNKKKDKDDEDKKDTPTTKTPILPTAVAATPTTTPAKTIQPLPGLILDQNTALVLAAGVAVLTYVMIRKSR